LDIEEATKQPVSLMDKLRAKQKAEQAMTGGEA